MQKNKHSRTNNEIIRLVLSILLGIITTTLLILCGAFLLTKNDIPHEYIKFFWIPIALISGIISGFSAGKLMKNKGILWGSIASFVSALVLLIFIYIYNGTETALFSLLILPLEVIPGAVCGIIASNLR